MAFDGTEWDETTPTNASPANEIDDNMRDMKSGVSGRMAHEHVWSTSQAATNEAGLHKYVSFVEQTSSPGLVVGTNTQQGLLYVDSAANSLIFKDSAGGEETVVQGPGDSTGGLMPSGVILPYGGTASPTGFIMCTGGAFSRTTYVRLFTTIGVAYGSGDDSTTFNVPDGRPPVEFSITPSL